jgi:hypothetical protein
MAKMPVAKATKVAKVSTKVTMCNTRVMANIIQVMVDITQVVGQGRYCKQVVVKEGLGRKFVLVIKQLLAELLVGEVGLKQGLKLLALPGFELVDCTEQAVGPKFKELVVILQGTMRVLIVG